MIITEYDKQKVKDYLKEAVKATQRMKEEQSHITDILNTLKADHEVKPAQARKIISMMLKGNAGEVREELEELELLMEVVG